VPDFKQIPAIAVCLSGLMLAVRPESNQLAVAFIGAASLFAFEMWVVKKEDPRVKELESQVKTLKDKVEGILLKQGLGR
jgi:hypothetical protein